MKNTVIEILTLMLVALGVVVGLILVMLIAAAIFALAGVI